MLDTMYNTHGVGLAAVQIGVLKQVVVIDLERQGSPNPQVFLNPRILQFSGESKPFREGCLSLPGTMIDVVRPQRIKIAYANLSGDEVELKAEGILAICLQHEIDHLNGILITDHARIIDDAVH
jgi:peptide deformylase